MTDFRSDCTKVTLTNTLRKTIESVGLSRITDEIIAASLPAIHIDLQECHESDLQLCSSKIGGSPDLPIDYVWPQWKGKPMGFIAQFDLGIASKYDLQSLLPTEGLLSFFYDLDEQPWGYDPKQLGYSRIEYFPPDLRFTRRFTSTPEFSLKCSVVAFSTILTIPVMGSQDYDKLEANVKLSEEKSEIYWNLPDKLLTAYQNTPNQMLHQILGHSHNVQNDMQLEAELVTNGLYCGDPSGYNDPRAELLKTNATEWQLIFQLDSDDLGEFMWGDGGMLYYWLRKSDLRERKFEYHWMTMQCY